MISAGYFARNGSWVSLKCQELLFIQGISGWALKDWLFCGFSPLRECDLNEESHCFRHSLEMRFVLVDSTSQLTYISPILEVYKFLFALSALRQRSLANRDSHFIYLFLVVLDLHWCAQAFSSCSDWGLLLVAVRGLLIEVASLVAEHGL